MRYLFECPVCEDQLAVVLAYSQCFYSCFGCGIVISRDRGQSGGVMGPHQFQAAEGAREGVLLWILKNTFGINRVLVYGCGITRTPIISQKLGMDVSFTDASSEIIESGKNEYGNVFVDVNELNSCERFDAIVAVEVIEHFYSPFQDLADLTGYVNDSGLIVGTTDFNFNGVLEDEVGFMNKENHLCYWTEESLSMCFQRLDMGVVLLEMFSPGSVFSDRESGLIRENKRAFFATSNDSFLRRIRAMKGESRFLPIFCK